MDHQDGWTGGGDEARQTEPPGRQPVFNLPGILVTSIAILCAFYLVESLFLGAQGREQMLFHMAFSPLRYVYPLAEQGLEWFWTPVTYSLLHGGIEHLLFNTLWLMAFGAPVARRIGVFRYVVFWMFSAAAGAFFHAAIHWGAPTVLIGASGVVSALMGAACRFAFPANGGFSRMNGHLYPRQSLLGALRNRTVAVFTGLWFLGNILIALGLPLVGASAGEIAWDAHIGGFLFGYLLFGLFDPEPDTRRSIP
ncbi:rhomboid family intramembrane serine protease [Pseudorhizobium endolithicum]|uniref:Rhomboid family intramembrane serine protease n=1 Tax=Pseudorhizobium endolithicum TaxID=1191678 RepID=A0ABN7K1G4_9HYPH|nr:rhomboid family intramembrane serine protease [Pseudorhizobium endolithicum]CAD7054045.1 rhomboid family intramembrane serine protease [Pseudorhizobium endolithicum]